MLLDMYEQLQSEHEADWISLKEWVLNKVIDWKTKLIYARGALIGQKSQTAELW